MSQQNCVAQILHKVFCLGTTRALISGVNCTATCAKSSMESSHSLYIVEAGNYVEGAY